MYNKLFIYCTFIERVPSLRNIQRGEDLFYEGLRNENCLNYGNYSTVCNHTQQYNFVHSLRVTCT